MDITPKSQPNEIQAKITFNGKIQTTKDVINALQKHPNVRELHFVDSFNWYLVTKALPRYHDLRKLEFNLCNVNAKAVKKLVARFPDIESVKIIFGRNIFKFNYGLIRQVIEWKMLKEISIDTDNSTAINTWYKSNPGSQIARLLSRKCENLESVEILSEVIYRGAINKLIEARGFALQKLNVKVYDCFYTTISFRSNEALKKCPNLRILHVNGEECGVTVENNILLEELHLKDCHELDYMFSDVVFSHLHTLTFYNCQFPLQFSVLKRCCPNLKSLALEDLKIKDEEYAAAFIAHSCRNLERLSFGSIWNLSSLSCLSLIENLPKLVYLKYNNCHNTRDIDVEAVRKLKPNLELVVKVY